MSLNILLIRSIKLSSATFQFLPPFLLNAGINFIPRCHLLFFLAGFLFVCLFGLLCFSAKRE